MRIEEYAECCWDFAKDTADWSELDCEKFYTTNGYHTSGYASWEETCDNHNGGMDVSWAFHKGHEEIKELAGDKLIVNYLEAILALVDAEVDHSTLRHAIYEKLY